MGRNNIYIASQHSNRDMIRKSIVPVVEVVGLNVTSRWLTTPVSGVPDTEKLISNPKWVAYCQKMNAFDLEDIDRAYSVLFVADGYKSSGGMWVELGYCIAKGKPIIWYGEEVSNVFAIRAHYYCNQGNLAATLARVAGKNPPLGKLANISQAEAKSL